MDIRFLSSTGLARRDAGLVRAVNGVSLSLLKGRTLAVVGESGSGKSTLGKAVVRLLDTDSGSITFEGDLPDDRGSRSSRRRRHDIQMIFQDSQASMNPRMRIVDIVAEGLVIQRLYGGRKQRRERALALLEQVGIGGVLGTRFPHELSGGQRQRVCIARALAVEPRLVVCDEPTSALDLSIQAQILNLLKHLQSQLGIAYLLITHDMSVVSYLAHDLAVMYAGRIVEHGPTESLLREPRHPYTQALLSAVPSIERAGGRKELILEGELPSPTSLPPGCAFHPRCRFKLDQCMRDLPGLSEGADHVRVACHLYDA